MSSAGRLGELLRGYASHTLEVGAATEEVNVEVERLAGFQNRATTPSGNVVLFDEPVAIGGTGKAADPAEYLLAAVGASLSVTLTAHAAMRNIMVSNIRISLTASMDAQAFFEPGKGEPGLTAARIVLTVQSDADAEELRSLTDDALAAAPVLRALKIEPRVELRVEGTR